MLPAVDARRGELQPHGLEALHLAVLRKVVAVLVGDDGGHRPVPCDAAREAVLRPPGLEYLRVGVGGLRTLLLADGLALHAYRHLRTLYLKVLVRVPADDHHRLRVVAIRIELDGLLAGHLGADAVALALARQGCPLLGTAALGLPVDGGLRVLDAHGLLLQLLVAQREHLLAEVQAQLTGILWMELLAATAVYLALEQPHLLAQLGNKLIL